jgi:hypothetical protein
MVPLGDPSPNGELTGSDYGKAPRRIDVAPPARTSQDSHTLWAATAAGRIFISKNADAESEASVVFITHSRFNSSCLCPPGDFLKQRNRDSRTS